MTMIRLQLTAFAAITTVANAATTFTNAAAIDQLISNAANWDNGLPPGQVGTIAGNAQYDSNVTHTGYNILHTSGDISRGNGFQAFALGVGSAYVMDGPSAAITQARGITLGENSSFTLVEGDADLSDNNRDTQIFGLNSSIIVNGGTLTIGRNLINRNEGTFTVNGGTVTGIGSLFTQNFASASNGWYFNGGSTTADQFRLDTAGTAFFGGTSPGSLDLLVGLGNGVTLDWAGGSRMELTVAGADQAFYEGLYSGGTLLFEGGNGGAFGDTFSVSGSTLTLVPEPSSAALTLGALALGLLRRRRS
mgnify:CR=1 FL=1